VLAGNSVVRDMANSNKSNKTLLKGEILRQRGVVKLLLLNALKLLIYDSKGKWSWRLTVILVIWILRKCVPAFVAALAVNLI
jgi:hypothetical protein